MSGERVSDRAFYTKRAADERERAKACKDRSIAAIHLELAANYDRLVGLSGDKPRLQIVSD